MAKRRASGAEAPVPSTSTFSPAVLGYLERSREKEQEATTRIRERNECLERTQRTYLAWAKVANYQGNPHTLESDDFYQGFADKLVELGGILEEEGCRETVEAIEPVSDPHGFALEILRCAMNGEADAVISLLTEGSRDSFWTLGMEADGWLRNGLMYQVLGIDPPPEPPLGWVGSYPEAIDSIPRFVKWIDSQISMLEMVKHNRKEAGDTIANAYRLVRELEIPDVPSEPTESVSPSQELSILRNLRLAVLCLLERANEQDSSTRSEELVATEAPEAEEDTDPMTRPLSERQKVILIAALELGALCSDSRRSTDEIASQAEGAALEPARLKTPVADLVKWGLLSTKTGRGGGCWLTETGRLRAERLEKVAS